MIGTGVTHSGLFHGTRGDRALEAAQTLKEQEVVRSAPEWIRIPLSATDVLEYRYNAERRGHTLAINGEQVRCSHAWIAVDSSVEPPVIYVLEPVIQYGLRMSDASTQELLEELKKRTGVDYEALTAIAGQAKT